MNGSDPDDDLARAFEAHRRRLTALAFRVLGSEADAEDAVQEAWLRLTRHGAGSIDHLGAWLTTVVGRICIDVLRARRVRPQWDHDDDPSTWLVAEDDDSAPEDEALLADSVGVALLVVLDALGPAERLALVLHDMFAVPFDEVGQILGRSTDAVKMLASRARRKVQRAPQPADGRQQQREVVDAFLAAARCGDFDGLLRVLDPDVTLRTHTARGVITKHGADEVASTALRGRRTRTTARRVLVNGEPGIAVWDAHGRPRAVMACTVDDGRIVDMVSIIDAHRLAEMDIPGPRD
jgi:RNA polymerase sigma-70 factor (ECF subfamily)